MDHESLRMDLYKVVREIEKNGVRIDAVLLFGSRARGNFHEASDFDLAFVSRDFGFDRISEGALLAKVLFRKIPNADPVPLSLKEFLDTQPISPIVAAIKANYVPLI
jgi:uncharacterized protein